MYETLKYPYAENLKHLYKDKLKEMEIEKLRHAKNVVKSDKETIGIHAIIFSIWSILITNIYGVFPKLTVHLLLEQEEYNTPLSEALEGFIVAYICVSLVRILKKEAKGDRKDTFFVGIIENTLEEKKQSSTSEYELLKNEINSLKNEVQTLKAEKEALEKQKKKFGIHVTIDK